MIVVQRLLCTTQISVVGGVCLVLRNLCLFVGTLPLRMVSHGSQQTPRHSHIRLRRQVIPEAFLKRCKRRWFHPFCHGFAITWKNELLSAGKTLQFATRDVVRGLRGNCGRGVLGKAGACVQPRALGCIAASATCSSTFGRGPE